MSLPYYETAEQMVNRINMYFDRVENGVIAELPVSPSLTLKNQKITITGLSLFLGFSSVTAFKNYATKSDEFADAVAYGYLMIENHYEHLLQTYQMSKAGEVGLRRVGEWRESIDLTLGGSSAHNIYIGEAIKKWQELRARSAAPAVETQPQLAEPSQSQSLDSQSSLSTTSLAA
jgi:hypothetical protein